MIILRVNGGLGNQMFQYAFCRFLAEKYNQKISIDFSQFQNSNRTYSLDMFPLDEDIFFDLTALNIQNYRSLLLQENGFRFNKEALCSLDGYDLDCYIFLLSGYWQSPKYFETISSLLRNSFRNDYIIDQKYQHFLKLIVNSESVMVHIRRGDYLFNGNLEKHGVVDMEYVNHGMQYYKKRIKNVQFFIFSDDPKWCEANIFQDNNVIFIDKDFDEGKTSFTLMRQCKYFLISNSTFSWWAAWISDYPEKHVICPKNWFRINNRDSSDLIPPGWIRY